MKDGKKMTMVSTTKATTLVNLIKFLPDESMEHVQIVDAEFPVFGVDAAECMHCNDVM
jgi:hypothetical protein